MEQFKLIAPCGLHCGVCPLYLALTNSALAEKLAQKLGVPAEKVGCAGCRALKGATLAMQGKTCSTFACADRREHEFCFECKDFPCEMLAPCCDKALSLPHNIKIQNLVILQNRGVEEFDQRAAGLFKLYYKGELTPGGPVKMPDKD